MMQKLCIVLSGVFSFMLLARLYAPPVFGVWGLFMVISSIVETLRHALIKNGYILFINTAHEKERPGIEYAALILNVAFSFFLVLLFLLTGSFFETIFHAPGLAEVLHIYSIALVFLIPFSHKEFFLVARLDFRRIFFMYFARYGLFLVFAAFLFFGKFHVTLGYLTVLYALSVFSGAFVGYIPGGTHVAPTRKWDRQVFRKFLNYGKYVLGTNFSAMVFRNTDSFMTAHFISPIFPSAIAFYNSSTRIINFAEMPTQVMGDVMFPKATQIVKSGTKGEIKNIYEKTVAATLTLIIPFVVLVSIFPEQILLILAGRQYIDAAGILQVMILYALFLPFVNQFGNIMDATGRPKTNFLVMAAFAVFHIIFNLVMIKYFGLMGPAYAILLSYFLLFITSQIILWKVLKVNPINVFKNLFVLYPDYVKILRGYFGKYLGLSVKSNL